MMVERLFLVVPRGCLWFVIVVFPDHTHLLFFIYRWHLLPINVLTKGGGFFNHKQPFISFISQGCQGQVGKVREFHF